MARRCVLLESVQAPRRAHSGRSPVTNSVANGRACRQVAEFECEICRVRLPNTPTLQAAAKCGRSERFAEMARGCSSKVTRSERRWGERWSTVRTVD